MTSFRLSKRRLTVHFVSYWKFLKIANANSQLSSAPLMYSLPSTEVYKLFSINITSTPIQILGIDHCLAMTVFLSKFLGTDKCAVFVHMELFWASGVPRTLAPFHGYNTPIRPRLTCSRLKCNREKPCQNCVARGESTTSCTYTDKSEKKNGHTNPRSDSDLMRQRLSRLENSILSMISEKDSRERSGSQAASTSPRPSPGSEDRHSEGSQHAGTHSVSLDTRSTHVRTSNDFICLYMHICTYIS